MKRFIPLVLLVGLCSACQPTYVPSRSTSISDTILTSGYMTWHGQYFSALPYTIVSLDIYSKGLSLDSTEAMVGSGLNICLPDICLPLNATDLYDTTYVCVNDTDEVREYTFVQGRYFAPYPTGAYALRVYQNELTDILLIDGGRWDYYQENDSDYIDFHLIIDGKAYEGHFAGQLQQR